MTAPCTAEAATGVMIIVRPIVVSVMVPAPATGVWSTRRITPFSVQLLVPVGVFASRQPRPVHVEARAGTALRVHKTPMLALDAVVESVSASKLLVTAAALEIATGYAPVTKMAAPAVYACCKVLDPNAANAPPFAETSKTCVALLYRRRPSFALLTARFWPSVNSTPTAWLAPASRSATTVEPLVARLCVTRRP